MDKFDVDTREKIEKVLLPLLVTHLSKEFEELAISEGAIQRAINKFSGKRFLRRRDGRLILVRNYSESADGLFGDTFSHIDATSTFTSSKHNPSGFARFNKFLRYGPGLVFSKNKTNDVLKKLGDIEVIEVDAEDLSTFDKIPQEKIVPREERTSKTNHPADKKRSVPRPASPKIQKNPPQTKKSWADETDSSSSEEETPKKSKTPVKKTPTKAGAKKTSTFSSKNPKKREEALSSDSD